MKNSKIALLTRRAQIEETAEKRTLERAKQLVGVNKFLQKPKRFLWLFGFRCPHCGNKLTLWDYGCYVIYQYFKCHNCDYEYAKKFSGTLGW